MTPRPHGSEVGGVEGEPLYVLPSGEVVLYRMAGDRWLVAINEKEATWLVNLSRVERAAKDILVVRVVEAPVSPPEEPEQELTFHDDDRWEPDPAHARVEELEAALREILWRRGDPSVVRQVARRALRGSVPAGEDER